MTRFRTALDLLSLVALSLWLGVVVMSGLVAAIAFPAMKDLNPSLPSFSAYPTDHWAIAAGSIARRVFDIGAIAQWVLCAVCGFALAISVSVRQVGSPRMWQVGRISTFALTLGALILWRCWLAPRMDGHLDAFLSAAKSGATAAADEHRQAFNADHPTSARLLSLVAIFLLASIFETGRSILVSRGPIGTNRP